MSKPGFGDFLANWRESDLPPHRKLTAALRNNWVKMTRMQECCGHPGEPGC